MSDPVTNVEIEDVVSSIRRLFSEDKRQAADSAEKAEKQEVSSELCDGEAEGRLVLSPAFRVDRPAAHASSDTSHAPALVMNGGSATTRDSVDNSEERNGQRLHLMTEPALDTTQNDVSDVLVLGEPQSRPTQADNWGETLEAPVAQDDPSAAIIASQSRQNSLKTTIAELEAAISIQGNDFEPDGSEEVGSIPENEPLQWQDSDSEAHVILAQPEGASVSKVIELDNSAPQDVDPAFVRRHAAPAGEAGLEEERVADLGGDPDELQAALARDDLTVDDLPMDEEALRDLVSEVVRQELQGALGERITRNVRKLVRREIHRIISSQEFD